MAVDVSNQFYQVTALLAVRRLGSCWLQGALAICVLLGVAMQDWLPDHCPPEDQRKGSPSCSLAGMRDFLFQSPCVHCQARGTAATLLSTLLKRAGACLCTNKHTTLLCVCLHAVVTL